MVSLMTPVVSVVLNDSVGEPQVRRYICIFLILHIGTSGLNSQAHYYEYLVWQP